MKKSWRDRDLDEFISAPWLALLFIAAVIVGFVALWIWLH